MSDVYFDEQLGPYRVRVAYLPYARAWQISVRMVGGLFVLSTVRCKNVPAQTIARADLATIGTEIKNLISDLSSLAGAA